jgi:hypothetical protein
MSSWAAGHDAEIYGQMDGFGNLEEKMKYI